LKGEQLQYVLKINSTRISRSSPMGMVALQQRIASAFFVFYGNYGEVSRYAQERGVCRQWVYREAAWLQDFLTGTEQELQCLRSQVRQLQQQRAELEQRLASSVVIDEEKQAEVACVGQARGVTLRDCQELLKVLIPDQVLSVASLGRRSQAAGERAGKLLAVLDEAARAQAREVAADEIYVKDPVLMMVEPESLCWLSGRLSDEVSGETWAREFAALPNLEQVIRDGGKALEKGVALVNGQRRGRGQEPAVDQGDHFHAVRGGSGGLRKVQRQASQELAQAEVTQKALEECAHQGEKQTGPAVCARNAWKKAEQALDSWQERSQLWLKTKEALRLFTPTGELNSRAQAEAVLAQTLPQLPDDFAKTKRQLSKPEMLNYLDRVQQKLAALPMPEEVKQAAVRQEGLRRRPEALQGEGLQAAALRGMLLVCAVVLAKAGAVGEQAVAAVRDLVRRAHRASSLVECINSVLRMHQAGHRQMTQGLLDLKRLYWNCHTFASGRRRGTTPYQRLGIAWPVSLHWWQMLKLTPEQLRNELSTAKAAA
jgi:hypothetical protein